MRVRKTIRGVLCFGLAALLILGSEASASAAYQSSGGGRKNSFSLAAVLQFTATLTPKLEAGSGTETELCWFEQTENGTWRQHGLPHRVADGSEEALQGAALRVPVSFADDGRRFRYEIKNEAGVVQSEVFHLYLSKQGTEVLCERERYQEDLSERRPS